MVSGATLLLSPFAHEALSMDEMNAIARRAVDLHCRVQVLLARGWTIRVTSWSVADGVAAHSLDAYHQRGHLGDLVLAALDAYEAKSASFTPDELVTVANQSGIGVSRA